MRLSLQQLCVCVCVYKHQGKVTNFCSFKYVTVRMSLAMCVCVCAHSSHLFRILLICSHPSRFFCLVFLTAILMSDASFTQQLLQLITQQTATWRPPVAGSSPCGPPAASLHSSYTTTSSQTAIPPPMRPAYNTSGIFSSVSARPSHTNSIPSPSGNFQASGEVRSPAPHLQPYRPSMSMPPPRPGTVPPRAMPSQPASGNIPVTPPSFSGRPPSQLLKPNQSDPRKGPSSASTGGLPTPNLSAFDLRKHANSQSGINMPNILPRLSHLASLDLNSRLGTSSSRPANSSPQATSSDVVCLSDDE